METQQKEKKCCWYLWVLYNVILYGIIVVSGAILFMVMVGMIQIEGNEKKKKNLD
jgi:cytoskeletal protein RodZ